MKSELIKKLLDGERHALARVISLIEDRGEELRQIIDEIYPHTGKAFTIGVTGPPGAGKSTVTAKLVSQIRQKTGKKVAVIAVDPSSPFTGGAILGDRIRMQAHFNDPDVYIRSLGTRGKHGGLSQSSKEVVMALDAAGFEWIILETAGVGQTELDIMKLASCVCVILVPESGDGIQVMKAGLMEIADIFVVNKSDRPEADKLTRELFTMITINDQNHDSDKNPDKWEIPVLKTQAVLDVGIDELYSKVEDFKKFSSAKGILQKKRETFLKDEITEIIVNRINQAINAQMNSKKGLKTLESVYKLTETPHKAAEKFYLSILDRNTLK